MTEFCKPHHICSLWLVCGFCLSNAHSVLSQHPPPLCSAAFQVSPFSLYFCVLSGGIQNCFPLNHGTGEPGCNKGYEAESSQTLTLTRRNTDDTHVRAHTPTRRHTCRPAALSSPHCLLTSLSQETDQCCHKLCFAVACLC